MTANNKKNWNVRAMKSGGEMVTWSYGYSEINAKLKARQLNKAIGETRFFATAGEADDNL